MKHRTQDTKGPKGSGAVKWPFTLGTRSPKAQEKVPNLFCCGGAARKEPEGSEKGTEDMIVPFTPCARSPKAQEKRLPSHAVHKEPEGSGKGAKSCSGAASRARSPKAQEKVPVFEAALALAVKRPFTPCGGHAQKCTLAPVLSPAPHTHTPPLPRTRSSWALAAREKFKVGGGSPLGSEDP